QAFTGKGDADTAQDIGGPDQKLRPGRAGSGGQGFEIEMAAQEFPQARLRGRMVEVGADLGREGQAQAKGCPEVAGRVEQITRLEIVPEGGQTARRLIRSPEDQAGPGERGADRAA